MAISEVLLNDQKTDRYTTKFGIRTISFDAENGFQLNGRPLELKGGCVHNDNGRWGQSHTTVPKNGGWNY